MFNVLFSMCTAQIGRLDAALKQHRTSDHNAIKKLIFGYLKLLPFNIIRTDSLPPPKKY